MKDLWDAIAQKFDDLELDQFRMSYDARKDSKYIQLYPRYVLNEKGAVHYEWLVRSEGLEVALHCEPPSKPCLEWLRPLREAIAKDVPYPFRFEYHTPDSSKVGFILPLDNAHPAGISDEAVRVMQLLMERTWPTLEAKLEKDKSQV